jgi:hypothetical protein
MQKFTGMLVGVLMFVALAVSGASDVARADDEMGQDRAGRYYLKGACRTAAAGDRFSRVVWHGRDNITKKEVARRLPELKRESSRYARALLKWASHLYNPPAPWPSTVDAFTRRLANAYVKYGDFRNRQGDASNAQAWLNNNAKANRVSFGHYAAKIRARLGLPPPGHGC